jgi:hypothetical protein
LTELVGRVGDQEISVEGVKIVSNVFERIVVYKPGFEDIVEVWP